MKVATTGLDLVEGKVRYNDPVFGGLVEKFRPAKRTPFYFEFIRDGYEEAQAVAITADDLLDLLIHDLELVETRLSRAEDPGEVKFLEKCLAHLEDHKPICDLPMDEAERAMARRLGPMSLKPTAVFAGLPSDSDEVCRAVMEKAGVMFFYTAGKKEVRAWLVEKNADAVSCAGRIHTDLARGFIKAEIVSYGDLLTAHSMQDARTKGLSKLVDRDFVVPEETVLEIRFNV